jgi:hypothetical protein
MTWDYMAISLHNNTGRDVMVHAFLCHGRKTHRGPGSLQARRLRAVLRPPLAEVHRALAAPEGPYDLWGEGVWRRFRTDEPSQTRTSVWLPDGHGAAGRPDRDRPSACVLTAIARQTPHANISIIQGCQVGRDGGTTS